MATVANHAFGQELCVVMVLTTTCDGLVDEDDPLPSGKAPGTRGYGQRHTILVMPIISVLVCCTAAWFVANDTDCDDTDAAINPYRRNLILRFTSTTTVMG